MKAFETIAALTTVLLTPACIFFGLQDIPCEDSINCPTGYECIFDHSVEAEQNKIGTCYSAQQLIEARANGDPIMPCAGDQCCAQLPCLRMPDSSSYCADIHGEISVSAASTGAYAGQDCQYTFSQHNFKPGTILSDSGNPELEVIHDYTTNLTWQAVSSRMTYHDIGLRNYCINLNREVDMHWRPPSLRELMTLVDYGHIHTALAPDAPDIEVSEPLNFVAGKARSNFVGQIDFSEGKVSIVAESQALYPLCVYGDEWNCPENTEVEKSSGAVEDLRSGLIWARTEREAQNWQQSLQYCEALELEGHDDWRLPSAKEMTQLVDLGRRHDEVKVCKTLADGLDWRTATQQEYWTSTPFKSSAVHQAWIWNLKDGSLGNVDMTTPAWARCVRTRSD